MSDFKAEMQKNGFPLGSTADPAGGAYSVLPVHQLYKGDYF